MWPFNRQRVNRRGRMTARERTDFAEKTAHKLADIINDYRYNVLEIKIQNVITEELDKTFDIEW